MVTQQHHHRPTLKQSNKAFKSKHTTKGSLKDAQKGKVPRSSPKLHSTTSNDSAQLRLNRRNAAKQAQLTKRQSLVDSRRLFSSGGTPRIVAVVPLTSDIDSRLCVERLALVLGETVEGSGESRSKLHASRFKTSLEFLFPTTFYSTLDALLIADYVLIILSPSVEVDEQGETLMRTMQSVGMPSVVAIVGESTQETATTTSKEHKEILKSLLSFTQYFVPSLNRVYDLSSSASSEALNTIRALCESTPAEVKWRAGRSYLLADQLQWAKSMTDPTSELSTLGSLSITGIIRGASLDPNRLVHIPSWGDYQIEKILSAPLPRSTRTASKTTSNLDSMDQSDISVEPLLLAEPTPSEADSLVSTNSTDDEEELRREQTWPTDEDMDRAGHDIDLDLEGQEPIPDAPTGTTPKRIKRMPKGMSEYQAAWIVDSDVEEDDEEDDDKENRVDFKIDTPEGDDVAMEEDEEEAEGDDGISGGGGKRKVRFGDEADFEDLSQDEEDAQLASWRLAREKNKEREKEEQTHTLFPDEIDTPQHIPAQQRFARYRGLRSFRTSPWDPYENLPREYGRIFSWEGQGDKRGGGAFKRMERSIIKKIEKEGGGVEPGTRVTIVLKNVPQSVHLHHTITTTSNFSSPLTLFALLPHEHKQTVLNFTITRNTEYTDPVRSKDPMVLCMGFRRLKIKPVYSAFEGGKIPLNNVHKFLRYLPHGDTSMATIYGPVMFGSGKVSCVLLRETGVDVIFSTTSPTPALVASGTLASPSTTRIIAKRVILTGHPFKVHKKTATVRYMFFNAEDVNYFSPIQLHTKHGRIGHIKESLGTHGYFKAHFDGPISQMDTVCMSLYKRVWPRWSEAVHAVQGNGESAGSNETIEVVEDVDMD
ncbi:uncharacterized protein C8R40DRAFT_1051728 [Lentinula edodes]|uniref:uncharacterized protein n=1 Tax=Lentinula edodes TaxID=5353 RepID=UPI001E8E9A6D|nr:uncharacterized protein C8R40DRAFT_1051728 [Lentinula edodes]KAH7872875.1 hypothetical protein C8R40DRAFT_1051728 [Lentinula edodes]